MWHQQQLWLHKPEKSLRNCPWKALTFGEEQSQNQDEQKSCTCANPNVQPMFWVVLAGKGHRRVLSNTSQGALVELTARSPWNTQRPSVCSAALQERYIWDQKPNLRNRPSFKENLCNNCVNHAVKHSFWDFQKIWSYDKSHLFRFNNIWWFLIMSKMSHPPSCAAGLSRTHRAVCVTPFHGENRAPLGSQVAQVPLLPTSCHTCRFAATSKQSEGSEQGVEAWK